MGPESELRRVEKSTALPCEPTGLTANTTFSPLSSSFSTEHRGGRSPPTLTPPPPTRNAARPAASTASSATGDLDSRQRGLHLRGARRNSSRPDDSALRDVTAIVAGVSLAASAPASLEPTLVVSAASSSASTRTGAAGRHEQAASSTASVRTGAAGHQTATTSDNMRFNLGATPWGGRGASDKMDVDADVATPAAVAQHTYPACVTKADARWRHALDALSRLRAPRAGDSHWPAAHALIAAVRRAQHVQSAAHGFVCVRCRAVPLDPVTWDCGHTSCRGCCDGRPCARCGLRNAPAHLEVNVLVRGLVDKWFPREAHQARMRKQAAQLAAHGLFDQAAAQLDAAIEADPRDHVALCARSRELLRGGRVQEALRDADAAVCARPDWGEVHYRRALALSALRRDEDALSAMLATAAAEPDRDLVAAVATLLARVDVAQLRSRRGLAQLRAQLDAAARGCASPAPRAVEPADLECVLCARVMHRPVTTPCGHTYCAACLDRCLDYGCACPLCKTSLAKYLSLGGARNTTDWLEWALTQLPPPTPAPVAARSEYLPLFVCTTAFPTVACPLFVYEPRYRAMVRAVVADGSRTFGMVPSLPDGRGPAEFGTLQVIADWVLLSDGCSIITTTGTRRFRIVERGETDGYHTAQVQLLSDTALRPQYIQGLVDLHDSVRAAAVRWLRKAVAPTLLAEISRSFGPLPPVEADWLGSDDGPAWAWWLLTVLPLGPQLQSSILATTDLEKRLRAIQKSLEHFERERRPQPVARIVENEPVTTETNPAPVSANSAASAAVAGAGDRDRNPASVDGNSVRTAIAGTDDQVATDNPAVVQ